MFCGMKGLLTGIILALTCSLTFSQKAYNLSHQVLVPAGNLVTLTGKTYQQTVGETAVEVSLPSFYNISQGFQQPRFIPEKSFPPRQGNGVDFFPNPLTEHNSRILYIRMYGILGRHYKITVINLIGSLLYSKDLDLSPDHDYIIDINMAHFSNGIYIATVISSDGVINRSFKIDKL
jgi:hypothetical protein